MGALVFACPHYAFSRPLCATNFCQRHPLAGHRARFRRHAHSPNAKSAPCVTFFLRIVKNRTLRDTNRPENMAFGRRGPDGDFAFVQRGFLTCGFASNSRCDKHGALLKQRRTRRFRSLDVRFLARTRVFGALIFPCMRNREHQAH